MARSTSLDRDALAEALLRQHDVLTRQQALAAGMTSAALATGSGRTGPGESSCRAFT